MIEPVILKGFRDSLPKDEIPKKKIIRVLEDQFESYGFAPIDTPVLEYTEVLLGKGGGETDKQIFRFKDNGGRDVAMRFDLTVPFARFMASHHDEVGVPFKRYHISKVWRGENPQKGRYREFTQCDFDIVGADNALSDAEILSLMHASFAALGIENYKFHLSHRGLFTRFLSQLDAEKDSVEILRTVDKLRKIGEEEVKKALTEITASEEKAEKIIAFITSGDGCSFMETLEKLESLSGGRSEESERMREIYSILSSLGIEKSFIFDPSITRGLDYYTGIVYETFLTDLQSIGSVCSGGRYNDLASLYMKEKLPGVGASIGLDRLLAALDELKSPLLTNSASADLLIVLQKGEEAKASLIARNARAMGLNTAIYLNPDAKMKKIYAFAEANSIPYLLTLTEDSYTVKDLRTRETEAGEDALKHIAEGKRH
ncbi:MAG: histidine--tRNA ligase [Spirochaetes bacterium]|uniref:Histidine--tRNA ligase n=1 Tax=Candidatus Ornithospirochaeta stercoripullorum TaxID=2840899 RepID=A0A9D9H5X6_9SPIO|nr:histidine--tRNA ligase [Candidatus Ornithospirochaeta stercoripullorum]